MSELKSIVPDLELCKLIPKGEFPDSVMVWVTADECRDAVENRTQIEAVLKGNDYINKPMLYPAPTLAEILAELPDDIVEEDTGHVVEWLMLSRSWDRNQGGYEICYDGDPRMWRERDSNPANAALRLWLRYRGIEITKPDESDMDTFDELEPTDRELMTVDAMGVDELAGWDW